MNKCFFTGTVVSVPTEAINADGVFLCSFKIAVEKYVGKNTLLDYFSVLAWRSLGERAVRTLKEGDGVLVAGSVQLRKVKSVDGTKTLVEIVAGNIEKLHEGREFPYIDYQSDETPLEQLAKKI